MHWIHLLVWVYLPAVTVGYSEEERPKNRDASGKELIAIALIARNCSDGGNFGYGMSHDNGLDHCDNKAMAEAGDAVARIEYQEFKCESLRVHGEFTDGECRCAEKWTGPLCNDFTGCPPGQALDNGACSSNICQNRGTLSVGSTQIECSCPVPWEGRYCERLACWRKVSKEHERRWKNAVVECVCSEFYKGANCDEIIKCKNGTLIEDWPFGANYCNCSEGWMGEICDVECDEGMECIKNTSWTQTMSSPLFLSLVGLCLLFAVICVIFCCRRIRSSAPKALCEHCEQTRVFK